MNPQYTDYVKIIKRSSDSIGYFIMEREKFIADGLIFIETKDNIDIWVEEKLYDVVYKERDSIPL
jgi:hypothetical protein